MCPEVLQHNKSKYTEAIPALHGHISDRLLVYLQCWSPSLAPAVALPPTRRTPTSFSAASRTRRLQTIRCDDLPLIFH